MDCIVIGHNETNFQKYVMEQKAQREHNGNYGVIKCNSILYKDQRITYGELFENTLKKVGRLYLEKYFSSWNTPNFTVLYLTNYLIRRNFEVDFINFYTIEKERLIELLYQFPLAVVITTTFYVENDPIVEIIDFVKEHSPDTITVIGGLYIKRKRIFFRSTYWLFKSLSRNAN